MPFSIPPPGDALTSQGPHLSNLKVTAQDSPDLTVKISAGTFWNDDSTYIEYAGGNSPLVTRPLMTSKVKMVIVAIDLNSNIVLIDGTEVLSNPVLPSVPSDNLPLAALLVNGGIPSITTNLIFDIRPVWNIGADLNDISISDVTGLASALADTSALDLKADIGGTPSTIFILNQDHLGTPNANNIIRVERGDESDVELRWNETNNEWEFTNDGSTFLQLASGSAGTASEIVGIQASLIQLHASVDDLVTRVSAIEVSTSSNVASQIGSLDLRVSALESSTTRIDASIVNINASLVQLHASVDANASRLFVLNTSVTDINASLVQLHASVTRIDASIVNINASLVQLHASVDDNASAIGALETLTVAHTGSLASAATIYLDNASAIAILEASAIFSGTNAGATGEGIVIGASNNTLRLKNLIAGDNIGFSVQSSTLTISSTGGGAAALPDLTDVESTTTSGAANGEVLTFNSGTGRWENQASVGGGGGGGGAVQTVYVQDGNVNTGTTILLASTGIPQITNGKEFMTATITPTRAENTLYIESGIILQASSQDAIFVAALFQDSITNALAATMNRHDNPATERPISELSISHEMTAGTTSPITFRIRGGANLAGTVTFNGIGGAVIFGGVANSFIRIVELEVGGSGTGGAGSIVQQVITKDSAVATGTTLIPDNDTIPQNNEGTEWMTVTVTPNNATNILLIETQLVQATDINDAVLATALFQDSIADALTSVLNRDLGSGGSRVHTSKILHRMVAGTTNPIIFKVRSGASTAGTVTLNGINALGRHGGVMNSFIMVTEISPGVAAGGAGISQIVNTVNGNAINSSTAIPYDNTIPAITEGLEVVTVTITPNNADNTLVIEARTDGVLTNTPTVAVGAIFQGGVTNALVAGRSHTADATNIGGNINLSHTMTAGTISPITFSFRAGPNVGGAGGAYRMNAGNDGTQRMGGTSNTYIKVTEFNTQGWAVLETQTPAGATSVTMVLPAGFTKYRLSIDDLTSGTDNRIAAIKFSNDGGTTVRSAATDYGWAERHVSIAGGVIGDTGDPTASSIELIPLSFPEALGNAAGEKYSGEVLIHTARSATLRTSVKFESDYANSNNTQLSLEGVGVVNTIEDNDAVQFHLEGSALITGTFILEGFKS